ncbi:MAG: response regulator [Ginsengibacter sp.]
MKKILVVDDDKTLLDIVNRDLTLHGFDVQTYSAGNVSDIVKWNNPNLILLDMRYFGRFGAQICKELKEKYTIPIVLFSAETDEGNEFADYSADAFIQKPFDIKKLVDTIELLVN